MFVFFLNRNNEIKLKCNDSKIFKQLLRISKSKENIP